MSMFSKATANIVQQIDPNGSLIHVSRINDSHKLVLMRLVVKQKPTFFWQKPKYLPTNFTLSDLLQGEALSSEFLPDTDLLSYQGKSGNIFGGTMGASAGVASVTLEGQGSNKIQTPIGKLKKEEVDVKKLMCDTNDRRVYMQHVLVKQLKKCGHILALLTERIITTSTCTISEQHSSKGLLGMMANTAPACMKSNANVQRDKDVSMEIPPRTVIAYRLVELDIEKNGFFELCLYGTHGDIQSDSMMLDDGLVPELENLSPLKELPWLTRSALFQRFCEVMKDRDALSDVENTLQEWCTGDAPVETEQNASVSHSNSASAILDLLRPDADSHMESEGPGTPGSPLTAVHLLVSAMEALPDEALSLLSESSPDVLEDFKALLNMLDLKDQKKSCSPLPLESLPLPLQDDKAFHWVQQLLITSNVNLRIEAGQLWVETGSEPGLLPLVLCFTVQGLSSLCDQQN